MDYICGMDLRKLVLSVVILVVMPTWQSGTNAARLDATNCPDTFLGRCKCLKDFFPKSQKQIKKVIVDCSNAAFTDIGMLKDLPILTEVLIFTGNFIPSLPVNVFNKSGDYSSLEYIDLSNNHIRFIPGKAFHKVYTVKTLILNHNEMEIIDDLEKPRVFSNFEVLENLHLTNAFTEKINSSYYLLSLDDIFFESDLKYLKKLHLEQNEIWTIGTNQSIFCQLPALQQLYLGNNRLTDLDFRVDCMPDLNYIDVQGNMINRLSSESMRRLTQATEHNRVLTLEMQKNPFICDCGSHHFLQWINETDVKFRDLKYYECVDGYPKHNVGLELSKVIDLACMSAATNGYSTSIIGILSFLVVFMSLVLLIIAIINIKKVKSFSQPYWDYVTRKIGYTGIAHEEAPQEVNV